MAPAPTDVTIARRRPDPDTASVDLSAAGPLLRLLADPVRAGIVELLSREQLCNCHLQEALGAKQTLVSHHLKALREAGVVLTEPCGRFTYYRLAPGAFAALQSAADGLVQASRQEAPKRPC